MSETPVKVQPPTDKTPFVNMQTGSLNNYGQRFLWDMWQRMGGFEDGVFEARISALIAATGIGDVLNQITDMQNELAELRTELSSRRSYDDEIEELRIQLATVQQLNDNIIQQQESFQQQAEEDRRTTEISLGANVSYTNGQFSSQQGQINGVSDYLMNLTTTQVPEGTRLYYTDARARAAINVTGGLSYNSGTGTIVSGTSAAADLGTSGHAVPLLDGANTWSALQTFSGGISGSVTGNADTATKWQTARTISITGDLTYTSPSLDGSANVTAAGTLATVNSNVGSFGSSTAIPVFTVNGKGLITAASTAVVIAPAGTLSGTTLNASVVTSSLTTVGNLTSLSVVGTTTLGDGTAAVLVNINGAAATTRDLTWQTNGSDRWRFRANNATESGSNAGSNFVLAAYDDAGASLGNVLSVSRASQAMTMIRPFILATYTVAGLPSASTYSGGFVRVTDATAPTTGSVVVGGGAVQCIVLSDGTNWRVA